MSEFTWWYGFKRYDFEFINHKAFIVEPFNPMPEKKWNWCLEWPESFVERCGVLEFLKRGYFEKMFGFTGIRGKQFACLRYI